MSLEQASNDWKAFASFPAAMLLWYPSTLASAQTRKKSEDNSSTFKTPCFVNWVMKGINDFSGVDDRWKIWTHCWNQMKSLPRRISGSGFCTLRRGPWRSLNNKCTLRKGQNHSLTPQIHHAHSSFAFPVAESWESTSRQKENWSLVAKGGSDVRDSRMRFEVKVSKLGREWVNMNFASCWSN